MNIYPTLVIGIGGSGKLVCKFLKRYFAERFPQAWLNPATKLPPVLDILIIETEPGKEKEELNITGLPDVQTVSSYIDEKTLKAMQTKAFKDNNPDIANWLFSPLPVKEIIGGAGQVRQAGRLAFFRHRTAFGKIQKVITTALNSINSDEAIGLCSHLSQGEIKIPDRTPRCYIISSVCGGTGSGMLLDIGGIVNNAGVRTNLVAFLPKMFEPNIDLPESIWQTYSNTYATLKEINHYMTGGRWAVWYNEKKKDGVSIDKKIFDYCFLVDKESETVDLKDRLHVSPLVAEFLFRMISELEHPLHATDLNIRKYKDAELPNWCNGLGVSMISFPLEEIREILANWGVRDLITQNLSLDFTQSEIDATVADPSAGWLSSDFSYKNWENSLLDKNEYFTLAAESLIRRKGTLESKIRQEKTRIQSEYDDDLKRMWKAYDKYLEKVKGRFVYLTDDILCTKGLIYYSAIIEKLRLELHSVKSILENYQQKLNTNIEQLKGTIDKNMKMLTNISKKKWFVDIGWTKRIQPHVESLLRSIRDLFGGMLKEEKHKYAIKIIVELQGLIDKKKDEQSSLMEKLRNIKLNNEGEETKLWNILTFGSDAQIKVKSNRHDVEAFYNAYLKPGLSDLGTNLRKRLAGWKPFPIVEIFREIRSSLDERIVSSGFDNMTILDAMKSELDVLGSIVQDCITNKSSPFIRHTGSPLEDRFFVSGLDTNDLRMLPALPGDITRITSSIEKNKRKLIFIRLSAGFSISDLAPYDFEDKYVKAYEDSLKKNHGWIHILPEALGFEDPLGLSIGMEEESLIKTCLDVGILFQQKGYHIEYEEGGKKIVLAQGMENAIRDLRNNPSHADLLKKKLIEFFNGQTVDRLVDFLNDHDRTRFADDEKFSENHKNKYKNAVPNFSFPLSQHKIPSYILKEIEKRQARK